MNFIEDNIVFKNFAEISKIPRESGSEKAVSDYLASRARELGFDAEQDELCNLIIRKPASPGLEKRDAVILQAHMDMVCEKRPGSSHDFSKDPIQLELDGDWLRAKDTTLGADNGIGVAIAMSILESQDAKHPPLEVVFTVCEETDFSGAVNINKSGLRATRMINLDHACETELIVGSCGGSGVRFEMPVSRRSALPPGFKPYRLSISGLTGGHSGEDIHRGRASAVMLALRLAEMTGLPLVSIDGGSSRLAIPRDASAVILSDDEDKLKKTVSNAEAVFRTEFAAESELAIKIDADPGIDNNRALPLDAESLLRLRTLLRSYPNGIVRMFDTMEGIVESSDNIGIIETRPDSIYLESEVRGGWQSSVDDILCAIYALADLLNAGVETFAPYPPWSSKKDSALKTIALDTYERMTGQSMIPIAVHAGLECGFFAASNPGMDIIAIGPNCQNFHSPEERVSISSALRLYNFLTELLAEL